MAINDFRDLFISELQEARSVEAQLVQALGKMAKTASEDRLKEAFRDHLDATRDHQKSVEAILERLDANPAQHEDQSMKTLIAEAEKMAGMVEEGPLRDAALIASAQRIEHYEIALYGTLSTYAQTLGMDDDYEILSGILDEEEDADDLLSDLAEGVVNPSAVEDEAEDED